MRRIITYRYKCLLAIILFISIPSLAQKKKSPSTQKSAIIDSVYYDSKWRGVPDKAFASFLRVYSTPVDNRYKKQYRDYYTTGEVKGEGYYISIDPMDGTKSIYDGEQISYYKSGKMEYKEYWENGKLNGEKTIYEEGGLPQKHMTYIDGNLDGVYTEFLDNDFYMQTEYENGKFINPYYTIFDNAGRKMRYDMSGTPINDIPTEKDIKEEYTDGMPWYYYDMNGITLAACSGTFDRYGKYYKQLITIKNNLLETVEFDPDKTEAFILNKENDTIKLKTLSADDYTEVIQRQKGILGALAGVAAVTANVTSASIGNGPTSTSTANIEANIGGEISNATIKTSTYDYNQSYRNGVIMGQNISNMERGFNAASEEAYEGYLKRHTLRPGESMSGYILFKYEKGISFMSKIYVNGMPYPFSFDLNSQEKAKKKKKDIVKTKNNEK